MTADHRKCPLAEGVKSRQRSHPPCNCLAFNTDTDKNDCGLGGVGSLRNLGTRAAIGFDGRDSLGNDSSLTALEFFDRFGEPGRVLASFLLLPIVGTEAPVDCFFLANIAGAATGVAAAGTDMFPTLSLSFLSRKSSWHILRSTIDMIN